MLRTGDKVFPENDDSKGDGGIFCEGGIFDESDSESDSDEHESDAEEG